MFRVVTDYLDNIKDKYPDKVAFVDAKRDITFKGLYQEAIQIANAIIEKGYFKSPILLFMEKSVSLISCFMGVAYSGNFYSPIDTKMPEERINKILNTLDPIIVITDRQHEKQVRCLVGNRELMVFEEITQGDNSPNEVINIRKK